MVIEVLVVTAFLRKSNLSSAASDADDNWARKLHDPQTAHKEISV